MIAAAKRAQLNRLTHGMPYGLQCISVWTCIASRIIIVTLKTAFLSWLQNDGTRGFSKDQLEGKQLLSTFWPDALVVFRASP